MGYSLSPLRGWKEANVARGYMQRLHEEVRQRFPEIARLTASDDEPPYLVVGYIADWLLTVAKSELDPDVVRRIVEFDRWCLSQPPGKSADDNLLTIEVVALRERLFLHDALLPLIPHLMSYEDMLRNGKYLVTWVGADRYGKALALFRKPMAEPRDQSRR